MVTHVIRRPRAVAVLLSIVLVFAAAACDKVPLLAPTGTVITLFTSSSTVPTNGEVEIIATLIEQGTAGGTGTGAAPGTGTGTTTTSTRAAGTPVQNGTLVKFTATMGRLEPSEARTNNGEVRVKFFANGQSGSATITAYSGGASAKLENLLVGAAAAERLIVAATPQTLGSTGGTAEIAAIVQDKSGTSLAGVPVAFSTDAGTLSTTTATTDSSGVARTTLTTNRQAKVTARAGEKTGEVTVGVNPPLSVTLSAAPQATTTGTPVTFTISTGSTTNIVDATIDYGDGQARALGSLSSSQTDVHAYRAPGTYVARLTARDANGESVSRTTTVTVSALPVTLTASSATPAPNQAVTFTAQGVPASTQVEHYRWTFSDGRTFTTTGPSTTQSFSTRGEKIVRVDVVGAGGALLGSAETRIVVQGL